jgi:hypothetical protein
MTSHRDRRTARIIIFALACFAAVAATWAAHGFGRTAFGDAGGILVAFVAAMMTGAVVYVLWLLLLTSPVPGSQRPRANASLSTDRSPSGEREGWQ